MAKWRKQTFKLKDDHGWKCKPGYQIFVADRGAVRFDFPSGWVVVPGEKGSIRLHDLEPPNDTCRIEISVMYLPRGIDWSELPLLRLFEEAVTDHHLKPIRATKPLHVRRSDLELVWHEVRYLEKDEQREAVARACLARGSNVQPFITMDYWADDAAKFDPVWDELVRTLQLGVYVKDPTRRLVH